MQENLPAENNANANTNNNTPSEYYTTDNQNLPTTDYDLSESL